MQAGKLVRLREFVSEQNRSFIIAIDQVIPRGLHPALQDPLALLTTLAQVPCDALLLHSGLVKLAAPILAGRKPFIIKLTTATTEARDKSNRIPVASVDHALAQGAVGVAMNVFIGAECETSMLIQLGQTAEICDRLGVPLIAMINPVEAYQFAPDRLAYVCRVGAELGADMVKTDYPGSPEAFRQVVDHCPVPILIEESPLPETEAGTVRTTREAIAAGGAGVMFGSRVWDQTNLAQISAQIFELVHS